MKSALENHEFVVFYQPKYGLSDNQIAGAEALVRWKHPERGMISPGEFIPVFERNGFILKSLFIERSITTFVFYVRDYVRFKIEWQR